MCTSEDFTWKFDGNYGNCFSFNTDQQKRSNIGGFMFGLQLEFYSNFYESLTWFNAFATASTGLVIRIENGSHLTDQNQNSLRVTPGLDTFIAISREIQTSLPRPYSNCDIYSDSKLFKAIHTSPYEYSKQFCFIQCMQKLVIEECNCTYSFLVSVFTNVAPCETIEKLNCSLSAYFRVYMAGNYLQDTCLPQCPLECNSTKFSYELSFNELMGETYVDAIKENPNLSVDFLQRKVSDVTTARESVTSVKIFYERLSYKVSNESPQMDAVSLVANIGGNLGLFLGVSLFSLGEILTVLFELCFISRKETRVDA